MLRLPFFGKKKLRLAFEYGLVLAASANQLKVELTPELSERAEYMLMNEFSSKNPTQLSVDMHANILSIFETNMDTLADMPTGDIETDEH